jgi:hypothetical protein
MECTTHSTPCLSAGISVQHWPRHSPYVSVEHSVIHACLGWRDYHVEKSLTGPLLSVSKGYFPGTSYTSLQASGETDQQQMSILLSFAMQSADILAALLADAQYWHDTKTQSRYTHRRSRTHSKPSRRVLLYRDQAIMRVRQKVNALIEQPSIAPDDSLLAAIAYLMATEVRTAKFAKL